MTATDNDWRAELRAERYPLFLDMGPIERPPHARCGCGHVWSAHTGRPLVARADAGQLDPELNLRADAYPTSCAVMICGCELFRGEADR